MNEVIGYDCDGNEIYEYIILRAMWSNDIDISELEEADPRQYCAIVANDGCAYAISVYDWWNKKLINLRENRKPDAEVPIIIKPISEMVNYECAVDCYGDYCNYELDHEALKEKLNILLKNNSSNKIKKLKNTIDN